MNVETIIQSLLTLFKNSSNVTYMLYAIVVCLLTQILKKIFVNKTKTEIMGTFNIAYILPFVLGMVASVLDRVLLLANWQWTFDCIYSVAVGGVAIGAISTVMFRLVSAITKQGLSAMLKDETFAIIYHQLIYFGSVRTQLTEGKVKLNDFLSQVKLVTANSKSIYQAETDDMTKKSQLSALFKGIIDNQSFASAIDAIHAALLMHYSKKV